MLPIIVQAHATSSRGGMRSRYCRASVLDRRALLVDTSVLSPMQVFGLPQHLVVPLFQRPYVWSRDEQWQPLWEDVRRIAERRLDQPGLAATHFLGAVVLQVGETPAGVVSSRSVIDGQQRLTTLQLLLDATAAVCEDSGLEDLAAQLEGLVHNAPHFVAHAPNGATDTLKLRHSNRDAEPFREVMQADPPVDYTGLAHADSLMARSHAFFSAEVLRWLGDEPTTLRARATALTSALTAGLQIVVIDLRLDENSQEIFETLNARGTPLTAADLIRNLVFQRLNLEGTGMRRTYTDLWPFDSKFWEKEVSVGRYLVSRSSLFLNQWLVARLGVEVSPKATFARFKDYVEHGTDQTMTELLRSIKVQAGTYEGWIKRAAEPNADLDPVELSIYRTQAMQSEVIKPILIWLHEPGRDLDRPTVYRVVGSVESWLVRRTLLRLTGSDLGRVVADLIATHRDTVPGELASRVDAYLSRQTAASTYWPTDAELRQVLETEAAYRRYPRTRLRMVLEAAEDHLRGYTGSRLPLAGHRVPRAGYHIEHLLPQSWKTHWPVDGVQAELERDRHVHRLGNLTLLSRSLNASVSNGPWFGPDGKRELLDRHDVFLLNQRVRQAAGDREWDEDLIDDRTSSLLDAILATWPTPDGHQGLEVVSDVRQQQSVGVRDLVAEGLLPAGTKLTPPAGPWGAVEAEVISSGDILLNGQTFTSPSAAGHHLRQGATNGWSFWRLPDGQRLRDLRRTFASRHPRS